MRQIGDRTAREMGEDLRHRRHCKEIRDTGVEIGAGRELEGKGRQKTEEGVRDRDKAEERGYRKDGG